LSRSSFVKVLQLSDCHVSADPEADYRGQNADRNLAGLLLSMRTRDPDLVLLTGDVSEDASAASYARVAVRLGTIGAPVLALPGNHDNPGVMKNHFPTGPWAGPRTFQLGSWLMVALDSTAPGKISGCLGQQTLEQFDSSMRGSDAEHILVALHHQPVPVNAPWIDRYALEEPARFLNYIDRENRVRAVVWGHVHHAFSTERNGVAYLGAPSSVANSLPLTQKFTLDLAGPSCRWLKLGDDGSVQTGILRPCQSSTGRTSHKIR
jgi:Icc protein